MAHGEKSLSPQHHAQSFQNDSSTLGSQVQGRSIPKIEFPGFDCEEPISWIRKLICYFHIVHTIPEDQKVPLASVHLDGNAELWYQGLTENRGILTWPQFMQAVYERFDGIDPGMILGEFTKLQQNSDMDIRGPVLAARPTKLHQALMLAKHQHDTVEGILKRANNTSKSWQNNKTFTSLKPNLSYTPSKPTYSSPK
ncbi:hypothetical protein Salat_0467300 [Sesamum alatum]|uniref:Retrotransposon gag domain-containing protein n=1 Tax=Sesamum alatum TaxID=300844 RepID=A0AAE1Z3V9_9LAMI|nr:hypothetical protein Salat_0467300 [Sesamum alatum]